MHKMWKKVELSERRYKNSARIEVDRMNDRKEISSENMFIKLGYSKIWYEDGFFYYKEKNNKAIAFDLKKKEWSVYDYDTEETRKYGDEELKAILFQEYELGWINTENFGMEFENKMYKINELQKENEELKEKYDIDIHELQNLLSDTEVEMLDWRNKYIKLEAENRELKTF